MPAALPVGGKGEAGPLARWLAEAIRFKTGADVALIRDDMLRHALTAGPVTADDLFRTVVNGSRRQVSTATLSGQQFAALLDQLRAGGRGVALAGTPPKEDTTARLRVALPRGLIPKASAESFEHADFTVDEAAVAYARRSKDVVAPPPGQ